MQNLLLMALSPLDGRYRNKLSDLPEIASEYGLIRYRLMIEIHWLLTLADMPDFTHLPKPDESNKQFLQKILHDFNLSSAEQVKSIEETTNHDVKAIEYFLKEILESNSKLKSYIPFIHFGCTSEDINNLAYGLMLIDIRQRVLSPAMHSIIHQLILLSQQYIDLPMLARTHGQPASPTTLGKELANVVARLNRQLQTWETLPILGKFNGAVGNFNAFAAAAPEVDWIAVTQAFISSLGLTPNLFTTQIEPHDYLAELLQTSMRFNTILIDLNRDIWGYISLGYFGQKKLEHEVGSSTMPHKINPIDFENSEGNLGIANALAGHLAEKLPISRWQRDLTDSTVLRNLGSVAGYSLIAYQSILKGLQKLTVNSAQIQQDLNQHWEILAEPIQTVLRRHGMADAYERLKSLTRGRTINQKMLYNFIEELPLPDKIKKELQALTPDQYTGYAAKLAQQAIK